MRAQFVLSEMLIGLRRNILMTIAVVVTVAISLALFGSGLLFRTQIGTMKDYWYDKIEVSIYLKRDVSQAQREQLQQQIAAKPEVEEVFYESQAEAYARFKKQFKDSPALVDNVTADSMPESFRVKLVDPKQFAVISDEFSTKPGVEAVQNQRELLEKFFKVLNGFQLAAWVIALMLLLATGVLISNTIQVAAFSRRRETSIMRLVGASNLYIQLPFLLEGVVAGLIGTALATVFLGLFKAIFIDHVLRPNFRFTAFVGWGAVVWPTVPILLVVGVGMAAAASFFTLRRYLRV